MVRKRTLFAAVAALSIVAAQAAGMAGSGGSLNAPAAPRLAANSCAMNGTATSGNGLNAQLKLTKICTLTYRGPVYVVTGTADGQEGSLTSCPFDSPLCGALGAVFDNLLGRGGAYLTLRVSLVYGPTVAPKVLASCGISGRSMFDPANAFTDYNIRCVKKTQNTSLPKGSPLRCILEVSSPSAKSISGLGFCASLPTSKVAPNGSAPKA